MKEIILLLSLTVLLLFLPVICFILVIRLVKSDYKKLFYNSIIVACFMFSLFLNLVLSENFRSLKANLLSAGFILSILYVLALKKSKEPLPEPDSKLLELFSKLLKPVSKLISCLNIDVPISVIIIIGLFNYCFACFVAIIIIIILIYLLRNVKNVKNVKNILIYLENYHMKEVLAEVVATAAFFIQLFIIPPFLYTFIKSNVHGFIKSIIPPVLYAFIKSNLYGFIKSIIVDIIVIKPNFLWFIVDIFIILFDFIVNYFFIVYIVDKFNIEDKLKK